jgi:uracil-DNA glycosylase
VARRTSAACAPQLFPATESLTDLRARAKHCKACDLWKTGTPTVFGEGAKHPKIMFVGEQLGDQEDLQGRSFVGPAGKLLDSALEKAGIAREKTYITNAVKHFKWEPRGKRRITKNRTTQKSPPADPKSSSAWAPRQPKHYSVETFASPKVAAG